MSEHAYPYDANEIAEDVMEILMSKPTMTDMAREILKLRSQNAGLSRILTEYETCSLCSQCIYLGHEVSG